MMQLSWNGANAEALIVRNKARVDAELVAAARKLRVVGRLGVGLDNIDLAACEARGIEVIPATGANALAVAEYVIGTALALLRGAYFGTAAVGAGQWPRAALGHGRELHGKILGVVGFGSVGRATARLACALGMSAIGFDAHIPSAAAVWAQEQTAPSRFDDLLREADVVSLHVPLTLATRGLVDAEKLSLMKREAILVNTARGGVMNEAALAAALKAGRLGGAAVRFIAFGLSEPDPHAAHRRRDARVQRASLGADRRQGGGCARSLTTKRIRTRAQSQPRRFACARRPRAGARRGQRRHGGRDRAGAGLR